MANNTTNEPTFAENFISKVKFIFSKIWQFFVGGVVVLMAFTTNFIDLKQPKINVEITEIEQIYSAETDVSANQEFRSLRKIMDSFEISYDDKFDVNMMERVIKKAKLGFSDAKSDRAELKDKIEKRIQHLNSLDKTSKNNNLSNEPVKNKSETEELLDTLDERDDVEIWSMNRAKHVLEKLNREEPSFQSINEDISNAEIEVKNYREKIEKLEAKIAVTVVVSNSGDGSTTLKPQALLRTDLGQGNYLDINLKIVDYSSGNSDIKPRSAIVLKLESQPIGRMAPDDRERFLSFFKNTSPTSLFATDVRGDYYHSNVIPFAQGIYEQKIYDGLKNYASTSQK